MMFTRAIAFFYFVLSLSILAAAIPGGNPPTTTVTVTAPASQPTSPGTCSTGPIQCCDSVQKPSDPVASLLLGLLGIVLQGINANVGVGCSPISVIGVGGGNCNANVVCCQNNNVGGLLSIGCLPIIL